MVNITALTKILRFISEDRSVKVMKRWSERFRLSTSTQSRSWYLKKIIKQVRQILKLISGGEIVEMLEDVLSKKQIDSLTSAKYKKAIKNYSVYYEKTELKQRHHLIKPLKMADFKFSELKKMGFKISRRLWNSCEHSSDRNLGGGNAIPEYLKIAIDAYLKEKSNLASNRVVKSKEKNKNELIPARYLTENIASLYSNFPFKDEISKSTFFKYLKSSGQFKKPHRLTDLCDYCEKAIFLKRKIIATINDLNEKPENIFDSEALLKHYYQKGVYFRDMLATTQDLLLKELIKPYYEKCKELCDNLQDYDAILFHKNIAHCQRLAYNQNRKNVEFLRNRLLIELDFKQKFVIGISPRQVSSEYYEQSARSCLGFGVYFVENDEIKSTNFDIISNHLLQDGNAAVKGFRILRKQDFFRKIETRNYIVWADCGKHFRCNEFIGYLLLELAEERIHVNLNFFGDKHGKNSRDTHFSHLSRFVQAESLEKKLESSQDIVNAIIKRQMISNHNKKEITNHVTTFALANDLGQNEERENRTLTIQNVESFYNYRTIDDDFKLASSVLSNENNLLELKVKNLGTIPRRVYEVIPEINTTELDLSNLINKKHRIKSALIKIQNNSAVNINNDFFNYFSLPPLLTVLEEPRELPKYCKSLPGSQKKPACSHCRQICAFSIQSLLHPVTPVGQNDILDELQNHFHPRSRVIVFPNGNTRQRITREAARELADH